MDNFKEKVGKTIKVLRMNQKKTRDALACEAGISSRFLYEIETGKKGMSAETLYGLARALEASADYILSVDDVK